MLLKRPRKINVTASLSGAAFTFYEQCAGFVDCRSASVVGRNVHGPQLTVAVPAQSVAAGATQTLQIHLEQSAERTATLLLVVTYPNGGTERSHHTVRGSAATLSWTVPQDAGTGVATFTLSADGCGCGQKGTVPPPAKLESALEGTFQVARGS